MALRAGSVLMCRSTASACQRECSAVWDLFWLGYRQRPHLWKPPTLLLQFPWTKTTLTFCLFFSSAFCVCSTTETNSWAKGVFLACLTNSIRLCSLYVSIARLQQHPVKPFLQEGKHPPDIFILKAKEPWKVAAQQYREQLHESHICS